MLTLLSNAATKQFPWVHGDLEVAKSGHRLQHRDGTVFFWLGDTAWSAFNKLDQASAEFYLMDRANKHYTVIQAVAAYQNKLLTPNLYGEVAFIDGKVTAPNEKYWKNIDFFIKLAAKHGLYIAMLPVWGRNAVAGWGGYQIILNHTNAMNFGKWLGRRYRDYPNIIWVLGGDVTGDAPRGTGIATWTAMAEGIKSEDSHHLITFHPNGANKQRPLGCSSSQWFADKNWLDFNMIQSGHCGKFPAIYSKLTHDYKLLPTKPVLDAEPRYEGICRNLADSGDDRISAFEVRAAAYWQLFAGACGHTYGNNAIWQIFNQGDYSSFGSCKPWRQALNDPGSIQMQYVADLLRSRPLNSRIPDQLLIDGNVGRGIKHIQACRGQSYAFIYLPMVKNIKVRMGKISGSRITAWWYNPRNGRASKIGILANSGSHLFTVPGESVAGNDWILVLDDTSKHYLAPGAVGYDK
jgi:hypothetical protein